MTGAQVVVVEDNERNMKLFREVLESSGYAFRHPELAGALAALL